MYFQNEKAHFIVMKISTYVPSIFSFTLVQANFNFTEPRFLVNKETGANLLVALIYIKYLA